jgi:hypothetical protein
MGEDQKYCLRELRRDKEIKKIKFDREYFEFVK